MWRSMVAIFLLLGCSNNGSVVVEPPLAASSPSPVMAEGLSAMPAGAVGREAQCAAGGARACLSLCQEEAECTGKDACDRLAASISPCASGGDVQPGSLCTLQAEEIAPTQASVGMFAAECRANKITDKNTNSGKKLKRYLLDRSVPAVRGSDGRFYITDRHHLSTGVLKADIQPDRKNLFICTMADKSEASSSDFWAYMEANHFTWLYNNRGQKITPDQIPPHLHDLADDPYRTLARWVRNSCGFIKCGTQCGGDGQKTKDLQMCETCPVSPYFLEFKWANYLRDEVPIPGIYELQGKTQAEALRQNLTLAMQAAAQPSATDQGLPGWNAGLIETKLIGFDENDCDQ